MINSARPLILDLGCCGTSALQTNVWGDELPGVDGDAYELEPGQANLLIVAGRLSPAFCPWLSTLYEQLARPKWVIAFGTCAASGALFDTVAVEQVIPVDVVLPGCPPHPSMLRDAVDTLVRQRPR